jgi:hypothetical protein
MNFIEYSLIVRQIGKKIRFLGAYNNLNFDDNTKFKNIKTILGEIYPELLPIIGITIKEYNNALDIVLQKEGLNYE